MTRVPRIRALDRLLTDAALSELVEVVSLAGHFDEFRRAALSKQRYLVAIAPLAVQLRAAKRETASYIRNTPNFVSSIGACRAASRPMDSTRRVSSGSMIPSSQSRAVAKYGEPSRS